MLVAPVLTPANLTSNGYLPAPYSLHPLPPSLRRGLYAISAFSLLSLISTTLLLSFLSYRLFLLPLLRPHSPASLAAHKLRRNQSIILIYNLLLADLQQAIAFVLNFHWARLDAILAPSMVCSAQGWFVLMGDLSSGLFSLLIAAQTFSTVCWRWQPNPKIFMAIVISTWMFALGVSMTGPLAHGSAKEFYFVRANAWCWVSAAYEKDRLWLHYFWIFCCEFGSLALYFFLFVSLRRSLYPSLSSRPHATAASTPLIRIAKFMLLYPIAYTVLTLPLAAGRMSTSAGNPPGLDFFIVAGALMSSCGWVDVLLFMGTKRLVVLVEGESEYANGHGGRKTGGSGGNQLRYGTITTIVNLKDMNDPRDRDDGGMGGWGGLGGSRENIVRLDQVVEITVEDLEDGRHGGGGDSLGGPPSSRMSEGGSDVGTIARTRKGSLGGRSEGGGGGANEGDTSGGQTGRRLPQRLNEGQHPWMLQGGFDGKN